MFVYDPEARPASSNPTDPPVRRPHKEDVTDTHKKGTVSVWMQQFIQTVFLSVSCTFFGLI